CFEHVCFEHFCPFRKLQLLNCSQLFFFSCFLCIISFTSRRVRCFTVSKCLLEVIYVEIILKLHKKKTNCLPNSRVFDDENRAKTATRLRRREGRVVLKHTQMESLQMAISRKA
ncbi:hypothetical protein Tcan_01146, partial [Toxocara canis]